MLANDLFRNGDGDYVIELRRELHMYPETDFDLPKTVALVKRELTAMEIPFTEQYGTSSVVATINPQCSTYTIGIRADMDALPIIETTGLPYSSKIHGKMHACGHDAHTAILLGTARALKRVSGDLNCRVMLLFQPSEEGEVSGAEEMVKNGVMEEIDVIIGLHIETEIEAGNIGVCFETSMAARHRYSLEYYGKSAHAAFPQTGCDTLAMAIKTYNNLQVMLTREIDPLQHCVCSINLLNAGTADNVVADYANMLVSVRTFDLRLDQFIQRRIEQLAGNAAAELGGTVKVTHAIEAYPVTNSIEVCKKVRDAAEKAVGPERVVEMPAKMSSEDFSFYLAQKPGCFFGLGARNAKIGCVATPHNGNFVIDEDGLINGCKTFVQFVLDNMDGVSLK